MSAQAQDTFEIQTGARVTTSPRPGSANDRNKDMFYALAELFAEIQSDFIINTVFKKHFETMWAAMENTHGTDFWVIKEHSDPSTYKYGVPHLFAAACKSMQPAQDENKAIVFSSANGHIKVKKGTFHFVPQANGAVSDPRSGLTPALKKMTVEDAFNVLMLASFNDHAPRRLELIGGNEENRAIYYRAIKAFNKSVPSDMRFRLDEELEQLVQNASSADQELTAYMGRIKSDKFVPSVNQAKNPVIVPDTEAKPQSTKQEETAPSENALHAKAEQSESSPGKDEAPTNISTLYKDAALKQIRAHLEPASQGIKWDDKDVAKYWSYLSEEAKSDIYSEIVSAFKDTAGTPPQAERSRNTPHNNGNAPSIGMQ